MASDSYWEVAICDDNTAFLAQPQTFLNQQLTRMGQPHGIQAFHDSQELLTAAQSHPFSLAVLDIRMPKEDGIRLAEKLLTFCPDCQIIFLTAFLSYAQDVYDVQHTAFILKNEMNSRLPRLLEKLQARMQGQDPQRVALYADGITHLVEQHQICWIERRLRTTRVHCQQEDLLTQEKLEDLLVRLDPILFCQCHKSYAVCWASVRTYSAGQILLNNGTVVPVSRRFAPSVRASFLRYVQTLSQEVKT